MNALRRLLTALVFGLAVTSLPTVASADDIALDGISSVSGIYWDEDSGTLYVSAADAPGEVQMLDESGESIGQVSYSAQPESVQGLAVHAGQLYIADIGDEAGQRDFVSVFGVTPADGQQRYRAWDFEFPDGPQNATAFLVSGKGRFYFITSGENPGIYRAELEPSRDGVNALVRAADAPDGVTDATFLDDGATMLVRTADGVVLINAFSWETQATTTYVDAPGGESITQFGNGRMLVGGAGTLRDEPLPDGETTVTPAPASPSADPSAEPSQAPTPSEAADPASPAPDVPAEAPDEVSRGGTLIALAVAVLVAVVAGTVVFVSRD
ncbi:hypothetical protein LKO27_01080 [Tessaracoccus sp. OS52]|uniref:hypothetical protein n=1 Tax=Tessaracoccus sp. OS52 TaxID=2886691 RepID=UPI001D11432A|nr:hypothetical protein [Tessaracoccus sp. OS52]MCC2592024.1 hypothetical protein [Tessaracoccus sp. OS52]